LRKRLPPLAPVSIRAAKNVAQLELPGGSVANVVPDVSPFVECDTERVIAVDILCEPVDHASTFRFEGAEESVPDNENAGVVAIKIFAVGAMVDPMM